MTFGILCFKAERNIILRIVLFYCQPAAEDYINHCCDPNAGLDGSVNIVAMRDIAPEEEVTYDYGTTHGTGFDNFHCACGTPHCRGAVTGEDWKRPELQERYAGYFSLYLQRHIDALRRHVVVSSNGYAAVLG